MMTMIKNTYIPIKNCDHSTNCSLLLYRLALIFPLFFFYGYGDHRDLHSFPTRRSSDLGAHPHVPVTEALQRLPRPARQPRDALHRAHPLGQLRQHRGLVPAAGAHLQNLLPPAELQQLRHAADDEGLRDRLPLPDRQRVVPVRPIAERLVHEHVARQPSHHLDHPRVSDPARDQLLLHHPLALAREPRRARRDASGPGAAVSPTHIPRAPRRYRRWHPPPTPAGPPRSSSTADPAGPPPGSPSPGRPDARAG